MRSLYYGQVTVENHKPSMDLDPNEPCMIFRGQDKFAPMVAAYYANLCRAADAHVAADRADGATDDFVRWQNAHPDRLKLPD